VSDDLRVTTARLRELAAVQERTAGELAAATALTAPTPRVVRTSHGVVASATASALAEVQTARSDAGSRMASVSQGLGARLTDSAGRYERTDEAQRSVLDQQIAGGR
jgi:hypothetical protein